MGCLCPLWGGSSLGCSVTSLPPELAFVLTPPAGMALRHLCPHVLVEPVRSKKSCDPGSTAHLTRARPPHKSSRTSRTHPSLLIGIYAPTSSSLWKHPDKPESYGRGLGGSNQSQSGLLSNRGWSSASRRLGQPLGSRFGSPTRGERSSITGLILPWESKTIKRMV